MWALAKLLFCYPCPRFIHRIHDRGAQAVISGGARCASQVFDRGAKADSSGRCFAVLSTQVPTVGLRLRLVVPVPMPAAVATRLRLRRRVEACLKLAATLPHQEKNNSLVVQRR